MISWLVALTLAVSLPDQAQPAGEPLSVYFAAEVIGKKDARATVTYHIRIEAGIEEIPLLGLHFLGARVGPLEASLDGAPLTLHRVGETSDSPRSSAPVVSGTTEPDARRSGREPSANGASPLYSAVLRLPEPVAEAGVRRLRISYTISDALRLDGNAFDLVFPILILNWPPTMAPPDMFRARLSLPHDLNIASAFPTVSRTSEVFDGRRVESFQLQVTPSVVRFRGFAGRMPFLTHGLMVDLGVALVLMGLLAYGTVRWHRSVGGEADE